MTTSEQRAKNVCHQAMWTIPPWVYDIIVVAIRTAMEEEREACAQLADQWGEGSENDIPAAEFERRYGHHYNLASAIRSRQIV